MQRTNTTSLLRAFRMANSRGITADEAGRELRLILAVALIVVGLVLGGGGTSNPLTEVILQAIAAVIMVAWLLVPGQPSSVDRRIVIFGALILMVPVAQLIPLPPSIWHALPGRELEREALGLVNRDNAWMPLSLAPAQTLAVALAMVPPIALMWFTASLDSAGRLVMIKAVVAVGIVSVMIGTLQLVAPGGDELSFYEFIHRGWVVGFQASRNAEVDVLLICLLACATLYASGGSGRSEPRRAVIYGSLGLLFVAGATFTGSRGGIIQLPIVMLFCVAIVGRNRRVASRTLVLALGLLFALTVTAWLLRDNVALSRVAARFAADRDFRSELWTDTIYAIHQYWPAGGGMGSFVTLMTPVERLEVVDPSLPGRAHNDYLELMLETGIVGPVVGIVLLVLLFMLARSTLRAAPSTALGVKFAGAAIFVIAVHSLVDYPMRTMSLAMLAAMAVGMMSKPAIVAGTGHATR